MNSETHHGPTPIKPNLSYSRCPPTSSPWPSTTAGDWSTQDIRSRRANKTAANEKAAREKAAQREVYIHADAIKPADAVKTLNQRFANIEARLDEIQKPKASTAAAYAQAPASAMEATLPTEEDYDDVGNEESTRRLAALEERLLTLETSGQTAKLHP